MKTERCDTCMYWASGECMRYPPRLIVIYEEVRSWFPDVEPDDWCGEHKRNPSLPPVPETER